MHSKQLRPNLKDMKKKKKTRRRRQVEARQSWCVCVSMRNYNYVPKTLFGAKLVHLVSTEDIEELGIKMATVDARCSPTSGGSA